LHSDRIQTNFNFTDFSQESMIANPQAKQKKLVARWLKDENSKLYCQWVFED
jgi:hypothetical protein